MKLTTNIVLTGDNGRTQDYVVQLTPNTGKKEYMYVRQDDETWPGEHAAFFDSSNEQGLSRKGNEWVSEDLDELVGMNYNLKKSTLRLYFPQYSADLFSQKCIYILGASIYVKGKEVELGCFKFQRNDSLACVPIKFDGMDEYFEYIDFEIPDPYSLYFNLNQDSPFKDQQLIVDSAAYLYITLYIVEPGNLNSTNYVMKDEWTGAQGSILLSDYNNLKLNIAYEGKENNLIMQLSYNDLCGPTIKDYINNVYNLEISDHIKWEFVIMSDEDIYFQWVGIDMINGDFNIDYNFDFLIEKIRQTINLSDLKQYDDNDFLKSWDNWKEGLYLKGSITFRASRRYFSNFDESYDESFGPFVEPTFDDTEGSNTPTDSTDVDTDIRDIPMIMVFSNKLPLTKDLFSKMLDHGDFPYQINLNELNMNNYNINAINKIENEVKNLSYNIESPKSHMIQPVFYQTRTMSQTIIHPAVTENIALNLETYKPYVKRFLLQIEGISFKEIGRTSQGIIFKIIGNMLPKSVNEGTMYVLDQDSNLVTTGKYKYSF